MICSKCGKLLNEDFKFCPECATPTSVTEKILNNVPTENSFETEKLNMHTKEELQLNFGIAEPAEIQHNIMKNNFKLKKAFLITMIASLSISALIGIIVILVGNLGETESKVLGTTLALGGFSLIGLCCSTLYEKKKYKILSIAGMAVCLLGFIQSTLLIWQAYGSNDWEWTFKILVILIITSLSMAQISILLLINYKNKKARNVLWATIGLICVVAIMLFILVYELIDLRTEQFVRFLSVLAILDALGTITTPILNKIGGK